ncbi:MAG: transglutaminase domain-containing protein [Pseudomonadota bacterium]
MNTPPFLLAAAALFWGSQTGNWTVAIASAALLEAPRYVARRWRLASTDFNRVADFCTVLLLAIAVYLYFTFGNPRAVTLLFQWMPVIVLPLALAQAWSTARTLDLSVLFGSLRRNPLRRAVKLNLGYPVFALWLLAASAANRQGAAFYLGLTLLTAWPLLLARPRSYATPLAAGMLLAAALAGYGGQLGLHRLQQWLETAAPEWLAGGGARTNPYRSTTDIGTLGDLKLSRSILLRVEADPAVHTPILLHRASYDDYLGGTWVARNGRFEQLAPSGNTSFGGASFGSASSWKLNDARGPVLQVTVHDDSDGNPVLSLPANTARVEGLAASDMKMNALGAVQIEHKPGFFSYRAQIGSGSSAYGPPTARDLGIPKAEAAAVAQIANELELTALMPAQALATVKQFFADRFDYSTWQGKPAGGRTPLAEFLLATRAGHCEYFASASVLLLRVAGIPARYATGFSAQEWSKLDGAYLVRERHAHAWVRAWVDGAWQDLDTTPPTWFSAEAADSPLWSPLADLWSWARFRLSEWSARAGERGWSQALIWLALPLVAWLAWRTLRGRRADTAAAPGEPISNQAWPGLDSEFYLIERRMAELGHARRDAEAVTEWLARVAAQPGSEALLRLARLHYRHRFDPAGLPAAERVALRDEALAWLARHPGQT